MGAKITIDSATLMNKGLEVIEATWLFGVPHERIEVVVHPQSIVHSMVAFRDGVVMAQMGTPDMKPAIAYALSFPERLDLRQPLPDFRAASRWPSGMSTVPNFRACNSPRTPAAGAALCRPC